MRPLCRCFLIVIIATIVWLLLSLQSFDDYVTMVDRIRSPNQHRFYVSEVSQERTPAYFERKKVQERWERSPNGTLGVKTILYWNTMYAEKRKDFLFGSGDIFRGCPVPHCYATPERRLMKTMNDYDAILFHGTEINVRDLPRKRFNHQRYIFFSWEAPASRVIHVPHFVLTPNFYNWTMSYRLDSDIIRPYGIVRDLDTDQIVAPPQNSVDAVPWKELTFTHVMPAELEFIKGKTRIAAWFVSHCNTPSKREYLAEELAKFFEVDIYGECGDLKCDRAHSDDCYDLVESDYYFYFSFENTLCKDYVTEKFFHPLSKYVIPVVYGGADYTKFAPPHSYINVLDFNSISELANFLLKLADDPMRYSSYFWWKKHYSIEESTKATLCNFCEKLHNYDLPRESIHDFPAYYIVRQCYSPDKLPWYRTARSAPQAN
ncbi:alpha-(1,3)-fucosyltransferase C-like [Diachasmimorpha longicaudata]|uniref:alpha-(1,3)-fucosyltransferase C-like n=1 Tax=Diachasmimorpha longicaudata TaxID=58733 RepID=UPI0030B8769D